MISLIPAADIISLVAAIVSLLLIAHGWTRRSLGLDTRVLLLALFLLTLFRNLSNVLESSGISSIFGTAEDFIEILQPLTWGLFLYAFLQQRARRVLRASEARFQALFDDAPVGYHEGDREGRIVRTNRTWLEMLGYSADEVIGQHAWTFVAESKESEAAVRAKLRGDVPPGRAFERTFRRKDGSLVPVLMEDRLLLDEQGSITGIRSTVHDITERKQAEQALRQEREQLLSLFESINLPIYVSDLDTHLVLYANEAMRELLATDPVGEPCFRALQGKDAPCEFCTNDIILRDKGKPYQWEFHNPAFGRDYMVVDRIITWPDGREVRFELAVDVTERKQAEEEKRKLETQMLHAQKLESLGVLAGGIAHDFNNLLVGILGNADLALDDLSPVSPARERIKAIETASKRAADLSRQMLAYSGRGHFVVEPIDLNHVVEEMTHLLEAAIPKAVSLRYDLGKGMPAIHADVTQIRQVIMNLITNASEAIGEENGIISVRTGALDCEQSYLDEIAYPERLTPGVYVFLEVADTGCGMDADTSKRIFDPFFTTKFTGRGLGLAALLGIVRGHEGAVKVYSEAGRGTTFRLLFPALDLAVPAARSDESGKIRADWMGKGTVLLVDDEETVRTVGGAMLERIGFEVLTANDGLEAMELFREYEDEIACVLLDLSMPVQSGEETFRQIRCLRDDVPVIMSSGYNEREIADRFAGKGISGFIQKPYRASTLRAALQEVLDS